mgnify:FL=1
MQVTHESNFITHAVISGTAQIDMGISNSAEFFQILSSTLYSDQMLAVVRETTCNAWDAHVESGRTDMPIQITVDSTKVVIRDFGHGIHHDNMGPIYGIYGASTKKNDGLQTGGFGLGCKAPFAYTDHFQVTSNHAGTKTIYSMSKSSAQVGGKPAIIPITSFATEDTGLEVSINIKREDMPRFLKLFQLIVRNGEMNAEINGKLAEVTPYSKAKNGFVILSRTPMHEENTSSRICVRYGNVIYPLTAHAELKDYQALTSMLDRMPRSNGYNNNNTLVLLAPPHSISVTPSREALSMQEHTINTVNKLIKNLYEYMNQKDDNLESMLRKECIKKATPTELLNFTSRLEQHSFATEDWSANKLMITDYKVYRRAVRSHNRSYGIDKKDALLRIKAADALKMFAKGKAHSLYRAIEKTPKSDLNHQTTWVAKHVVNPLLRKMKLNSELNASRLYFTRYGCCVPVVKKEAPFFLTDWGTAARYARPYVIIHYVRKEVELRTQKEGTLKGTDKQEVLFYHVPRIVGKVQIAVDFFTAQGYQVIDLTKPLAGETPESVAPVLRIASGTRQQGLIALSAASRNGAFHAETLYSEEATRISSAECIFLCTNTDGQRRSNALYALSGITDTIMKVYGDVAGVAKTQDQYDRYRAKGIEDGVKYVTEDVINYITESDAILQYLTAKHTVIKHRFTERIFDYVLKSPVVQEMYNLPSITEDEDKIYLELWEYLKRSRSSVTSATENDIDSLPDHQATLDVCSKIKGSKYYVFLETGLWITQTEFDKHAPDFINFINQ